MSHSDGSRAGGAAGAGQGRYLRREEEVPGDRKRSLKEAKGAKDTIYLEGDFLKSPRCFSNVPLPFPA